MRVFAPGVGAAAFGDEGSEHGLASTFTHGAGVMCPVVRRDDVLASIRSESAQPVEKDQAAMSRLDAVPVVPLLLRARAWPWRNRGSGKRDADQAAPPATRQLSLMTTRATVCSRMRSSSSILSAGVHEDAAGVVDPIGVAACGDQLRDLLVQSGRCRPSLSSQRITRSTASPFRRQYAWACRSWRTSSIFAGSAIRSSTIGKSPEMANPIDRTGLGGSCRECPGRRAATRWRR